MLGFQLTQLTMRNLRLKSCGCLVTQSSKINYKQLGFHELRFTWENAASQYAELYESIL